MPGSIPRRDEQALLGSSSCAPRPRRSCPATLHRRPLGRHPGLRPGRDRARHQAHPHPRHHRASHRAWTAHQARNLVMDLGEQAHKIKFMIRDRGSNYTAAFDTILADAGIRTVLCNVQTPRMNAIAERWIGGCRREILDRTLIWNQAHLRRILRQYETHHNRHRPHRSLDSAAPLKPLPEPVDLEQHPCPKAPSSRWHDQRILPGRMTWTRFSAPTSKNAICKTVETRLDNTQSVVTAIQVSYLLSAALPLIPSGPTSIRPLIKTAGLSDVKTCRSTVWVRSSRVTSAASSQLNSMIASVSSHHRFRASRHSGFSPVPDLQLAAVQIEDRKAAQNGALAVLISPSAARP